ncbi:MAG: hypothetical protein QOH95_1817 [Gaiellaceae bacterium]|nr:hypothetical protein [Gaiellaceae bacterium]
MLDLLAHAAPISYRFPLPIWLYVLAGGAAVLLSAPAAALAVHDAPVRERRGPDLYPYVRRLGPVLTVLAALLVVESLAGGLFSTTAESQEFIENPVTVVTWVDFWVGLGIAAWLLGNVYERVAPLNVAARALDRVLAARGVQPLAYPARLGQWPAVGLLLVWSWMELIWGPAKEPRSLALFLIAYMVATLVGCALYGAEVWLGNVELFSVLSRTLSRFSPLELRPFVPEEWAVSDERSARLRPYAAGLRTDPLLPDGGAAFVLAALATVVFDGWSQTDRFASFQQWFWERWSFLADHVAVLQTLSMLAVVLLFVGAYLVVTRAQARDVAVTLIPIAAVYFAAHYFSYLLIAGQATLGVVVDPFGHSWNPLGWGEYPLHTKIVPAGVIWWLQVLLIVWGHVAAVFAAHRLAVRASTRARALLAQAPLVALMVGYTVAGLWVLAQQIRA